ncbi:hypothetical protein [Methylocapsa sp. S129]|uniref:hypothetical protein n=1 Tax=Methylocapsa sp. S129 TaxID=1641869 RepID=UPI00131C3F40|nr:hypothetical protein [Methylocapsa sp. S129]
MLNKACLAFVGALTVLPQVAIAANNSSSRCVDVSVPKDAITARNGKWIELTQQQWEFMRGIYAMNPETPAGLPYGDKAVLAQVDGNKGGMVFFIDGNKACTPMPIPVELIAMMQDVATDTINHESGGL